jgi:hypothetical protein
MAQKWSFTKDHIQVIKAKEKLAQDLYNKKVGILKELLGEKITIVYEHQSECSGRYRLERETGILVALDSKSGKIKLEGDDNSTSIDEIREIMTR